MNPARILFTATPMIGHFLPLLTLARTAASEGHEIAILTSNSLEQYVEELPFLAVGPDGPTQFRENAERHPGRVGSVPPPLDPGPDDIADFFVRTRLELAGDDAILAAREFDPQLVVAESADAFGPAVAATLGIPWAAHGFGTEVPAPFAAAMTTALAEWCEVHGRQLRPRTAYLDPWPATLNPPGGRLADDRIGITLDVAASPGTSWRPKPSTTGRVLITLGTTVNDPDALTTAITSVLASTDHDVVVTQGVLDRVGVDDPRVTEVGFARLADLVTACEVVVTAGGAGTVLGVATMGVPMVVLPFFSDQRWHGQALTAAGAGVAAESAEQVGGLVQQMLDDPSYRSAAAELAQEIAELGPATEALRRLLTRAGLDRARD